MTNNPETIAIADVVLKHCPFCSSAPIVIAGIIGCPECASGQPNAERWNARATDPEAAALIEELREALDELCASVEREDELNASLSAVLMSDLREARTTLAKAQQK